MGEAQVLGVDVGARVRARGGGTWGAGPEVSESAERRHMGPGEGAAEMLCGARVVRRKSVLTRGNG